MVMGPGPGKLLPRSRYPDQVVGEFGPAPLDELSLWNGVRKFCHSQYSMPLDFVPYGLQVLDHFFPFMFVKGTVLSNDEITQLVMDEDHRTKTSGFPMDAMGSPTKGDAMKRYGVSYLLEYYKNNTSIIGCTLKDELRQIGKDARLFRPCDVTSFCEGARLFKKQNDYLLESLFVSPIFAKCVIPGWHLALMYERLRKHGGDLYDADGARWDANFPMSIASLICYWRSRHHAEPEAVRRYYEQMYCGWTSVCGNLFNLIGQPSGHYLTTTDNCLANILAMAFHAYNMNMSLEQFLTEVQFYVCGDDLIWSDRTGRFTPEAIAESYAKLGFYLEFSSLLPMDFWDLNFVSTHPCMSWHKVKELSYCYDYDKMMAKASIFRKNAKLIDKVAKISSLAQLSFQDKVLYDALVSILKQLVSSAIMDGQIGPTDAQAIGLVEAVDPDELLLRFAFAE